MKISSKFDSQDKNSAPKEEKFPILKPKTYQLASIKASAVFLDIYKKDELRRGRLNHSPVQDTSGSELDLIQSTRECTIP